MGQSLNPQNITKFDRTKVKAKNQLKLKYKKLQNLDKKILRARHLLEFVEEEKIECEGVEVQNLRDFMKELEKRRAYLGLEKKFYEQLYLAKNEKEQEIVLGVLLPKLKMKVNEKVGSPENHTVKHMEVSFTVKEM